MNEKEIAEVRRSLLPDRCSMGAVCGCYATPTGEIIATFRESLGLLTQEETETYCALFRRTLSGTLGRNLLDIPFSNQQIPDGEEYALLATLRQSELKDTEALDRFYAKVTSSVSMEQNYVILLTYNKYDVPHHHSDGELGEESSEVYSFLVCSICPVKATSSALAYQAEKKSFHHASGVSAIASPALGFLFPCFDDRQTNIYNALLYSKSPSEAHESFTDAVFRQTLPRTATAEADTFHEVLAETLAEDCSLRVVRSIHNDICARMEEHRESHEREPLRISKHQVIEVLEECGVAAERVEAFSKAYTEQFGVGGELTPKNLADPKKFEMRTPNVSIKVADGRTDLVETRVLDGVPYILIRAAEGVELNGLNLQIEGLSPEKDD